MAMVIEQKHGGLFLVLFSLQFLFWLANGDVYMHNPRGSNNRLNERNNNRNNANRLFDSQNNNRGGYNVGDKYYNSRGNNALHQNEMEYFMSGPKGQSNENKGKSYMTVEWTNQHGCGDNDLNCNVVLQYMCQEQDIGESKGRVNANEMLRNGLNTGTQSKRSASIALGLHEPMEWYGKCKTRTRNKGLFTADQKLRGSTSRFTRQNPGGTRRGYECPEERDYYPYWHPTDWVDEAVYVKRQEDCAYYEAESFNEKPRGECMQKVRGRSNWDYKSEYNNEAECGQGGGTWVEFSNFLEILNDMNTEQKCESYQNSNPNIRTRWAIPYRSNYYRTYEADIEQAKRCLVLPRRVKCKVAPTSRPNHLGNGENVNALRHQWILPYFPSGKSQRCVFRIRYNISTDDYDVSRTFAQKNERKANNIVINQSPIDQNPIVQYGESSIDLQLAINTAQFGRTFQDRSHTFILKTRPGNLQDRIIHNINVRGKRGNIVQVFPGVEYDYVPKRPKIKSDDLVHFQWTGANTNPSGNAGQGKRGTDRHNMVQMEATDVSYPMTNIGTLVQNAQIVYVDPGSSTKSSDDLAVMMASSCRYKTKQEMFFDRRIPTEYQRRQYKAFAELDEFPPSCSLPLLQLRKGTYYYMCTRNNNFSNRSQKGRLVVE